MIFLINNKYFEYFVRATNLLENFLYNMIGIILTYYTIIILF